MSNRSELALDALGDPMRRRIVEHLQHGPTAVGALAETLPIGRPAVSKHLRVLTNAGLVEYTSRGTRNLYALAPEGQREVQAWLVGMWGGALESFARYIDEEPR
jgi:DNA-binding transcriptional ArsR family regulator